MLRFEASMVHFEDAWFGALPKQKGRLTGRPDLRFDARVRNRCLFGFVLLQLLVEGASGHAETPGCAIHVARFIAHYAEDVYALDFLERSAAVLDCCRRVGLEVEDE
jgi:hypothetical protein